MRAKQFCGSTTYHYGRFNIKHNKHAQLRAQKRVFVLKIKNEMRNAFSTARLRIVVMFDEWQFHRLTARDRRFSGCITFCVRLVLDIADAGVYREILKIFQSG